ncbi:hypothetical protein GSB65_000241 [Salmonella enterica]|nr:hypothetical protein [Salmonella enterica]
MTNVKKDSGLGITSTLLEFYPATVYVLPLNSVGYLPIAIIHWSVTVFSSSIFYWQYSPSRVKLHPCPPTPSGIRS